MILFPFNLLFLNKMSMRYRLEASLYPIIIPEVLEDVNIVFFFFTNPLQIGKTLLY